MYLSAAITFTATVVVSWLLIWLAPVIGLVDPPSSRKIHHSPTPNSGGIAIFFGIAIGLLLFRAASRPIQSIGIQHQTWIAGFGFFLVGALDDVFDIKAQTRLVLHVLFGALAAYPWAFGVAYQPTVHLPLIATPVQLTPWLVFAGTTLWFVGLTNSVNIEDAINGHIAGICFLLLTLLGIGGRYSLTLQASLLGFLVLNYPNAKHFLGDSGSFGCGFILAELLLRHGGNLHPVHCLLLTAPITLDVAIGCLRRLRLGQSLMHPDRLTLPHRLQNFCRQAPWVAAPLLWVNMTLCSLAGRKPHLAIVWLGLFTGVLVWLNRAPLFYGKDDTPDLPCP